MGTANELWELLKHKPQGEVIVFDDSTGSQTDLDFREKSPDSGQDSVPAAETRRRGRPRLGVIAREVTLLPRHWDWLNLQPGGA